MQVCAFGSFALFDGKSRKQNVVLIGDLVPCHAIENSVGRQSALLLKIPHRRFGDLVVFACHLNRKQKAVFYESLFSFGEITFALHFFLLVSTIT